MSNHRVATCDYETQYFGFHPCAFTDEVYNTLDKFIQEALSALQDHLVAEFGHVTSKDAIEQATEQIFEEYLSKLDKGFDKLEIYLDRNIFAIPKEVVLPEDKIHIENPVTESEDAQLDSELQDLEQKISEAKKQSAYLSKKRLEQRSLLRMLRMQRQKLEKVENAQEKLVLEENLTFSLTKALELCDLLPDS